MNMITSRICNVSTVVVAAVFLLASLASVKGQSFYFTGGGTDSNWGTAGNWTNFQGHPSSAPPAKELQAPNYQATQIYFTTFTTSNPSTATANNNQVQTTTEIIFQDSVSGGHVVLAPSYTLTGNGLQIRGGFLSSTANAQTISLGPISAGLAMPIFFNVGGGGLTVNSEIDLGYFSAVQAQGSSNITFNGTFTDQHSIGDSAKPSSTLIIDNTGTVTLTAAQSYTGGTTINTGTLRLSGTGATLSSSTAVQNDSVFDFSQSASQTIGSLSGTAGATTRIGSFDLTIAGAATTAYSGSIVGTGKLIMSGTGSLSLAGTTGPSGGIVLQGGILQAGTATALGNGTITFTGGALQYGTGVTTDFSSRFSTSAGQQFKIDTNGNTVTLATALTSTGGSLTKLGAGTLVVYGTSTINGTVVLAGGALQANSVTALGTGTFTFTGGALKYGTGVTQDFSSRFSQTANQLYSVDTNGNTVTWATSLTSTGGTLTKSGTGTLILTGTNTYSGGTILLGGEVQIGRANELGTGTISFSGGALKYANGFTGDISSLFSNAANQVYAVDTNGQHITFASNLTSVGGHLNITGGGTLTLTGTNTFSGGTTLTKGTVRLGSSKALGTGALKTIDPTVVYTNGIDISNPIIMTADTNLEVDGTDSATQSGDISESGTMAAVIKDGTGRLILSGTNSYTGGTVINAGVLQGNTTSLQGDIVDHTELVFDQADNGTYAGSISGTGSVSKTGSGTVVLTGTSTYSGGTTLAGGTMQAGTATALGSGTITFTGGALQYGAGVTQDLSSQFSQADNQAYAVDTNGNNVTFATALTSTGGSLTKSGAGKLTLTATNTYNGGTTVNLGELVGTTTSLQGDIVDNDTVTFDQTTSGTYSGVLSGTGAVNISNSGAVTLTATNTYGGGTNLKGGTLVAGNASALGTGLIHFSGGTLQYGAGVTQDFSSQFSRASNQEFIIDTNGNNVTFASSLTSTNGSLSKIGLGTLILAAANSYDSSTFLQEGVLQVGNAAALGTSNIIFTGGTLQYGVGVTEDFSSRFVGKGGQQYSIDTNGNDVAFASVLTGSRGATLTKLGEGALTLAAANTYNGGTNLVAGSLIAANPTALGLGGVTQIGGTLKTDNINHVITIGNNFVQTGGTLLLNLNGAPGASSNDQVNVNGTAALGGQLAINYAAGTIAPSQSATYTVVTTTGGVVSVGPGYVTPTLQAGALLLTISGTVSGNDFTVTLKASQTNFSDLPGSNLNPNQKNLARYFDQFAGGITSGPMLPLLKALDGVSTDPNALGSAFDQLTPLKFQGFASTSVINNAGFATAGMDTYLSNHRGGDGVFVGSYGGMDYSALAVTNPEVDNSLQAISSRLLAWSPAPSTGLISDVGDPILGGVDTTPTVTKPTPETENKWNTFIAGDVVLAQYFSNPSAGVSGGNSTTGAVQVGADYKITPHWLVGLTFAYGQTNATLDTIGSNATVNTYSPGVYASYSENGWYANGLASYGFANYSQNRAVAIGAFTGTATSSPGGSQFIGDLDGGYDFHKGKWTFGPTLGLQYTHLEVDGYTETGLPGANLTVAQNQADSLRSLLGGRLSYALKEGGMVFIPHLSASWQHEYLNQSRGVTSQFSAVGAGSFVVNTPNPSSNSALANVGFDAQVNDALTVFVDYSVNAGQSNYFGQSVQAGCKIGF